MPLTVNNKTHKYQHEKLGLLQNSSTLTDGVEVVVAVSPGQDAGEGGEGVEEGPGEDEVVVDGHERRNHDHPPPKTCRGG